MTNYIRAIKRPFANTKKLLFGIMLNIPMPLIKTITNPIALGYALDCGKTASEGNYKLPDWKNYIKLWVNAMVAGIISFYGNVLEELK
tara:strand:+ start:1297 stop:1560 length:264 start_codon:yes stop_codon:yes gene_type:complete